MAVEIDWYDETRTTIHANFTGRWGWDEAYLAQPTAHRLICSIDHPFGVLMEFEDRNWLPQGAVANIPNMLQFFTQYKHCSVIVLVGAGPMINAMFNMVLMVARHNITFLTLRFSETLTEGQDLANSLLLEY